MIFFVFLYTWVKTVLRTICIFVTSAFESRTECWTEVSKERMSHGVLRRYSVSWIEDQEFLEKVKQDCVIIRSLLYFVGAFLDCLAINITQ